MSKTLLITVFTTILVSGSLFASETYKNACEQAQKLEKSKNYQDAQKGYSKALTLAKTDREKYRALFHQGKCFRLIGKWADAIKCFQEAAALKEIPSYETGDALLGEAEVYRRMKQYDKANEAADKIIAMKDTLSDYVVARAHLNKGENLSDSRKFDKAIVEFDEVIAMKAHPNYTAKAQTSKADVLLIQKKYAEAIKSYKKTLENTESHINYQTGAANRIASIQRNQKKYDDSMKSSQTVLRMKKAFPPHKADAQLNMGYCSYYKKEYAQAIDWFKKVMNSKRASSGQKKLAKSWIDRTQEEQAKAK
jgi:tetratricopeptide (TPR) repeat protein